MGRAADPADRRAARWLDGPRPAPGRSDGDDRRLGVLHRTSTRTGRTDGLPPHARGLRRCGTCHGAPTATVRACSFRSAARRDRGSPQPSPRAVAGARHRRDLGEPARELLHRTVEPGSGVAGGRGRSIRCGAPEPGGRRDQRGGRLHHAVRSGGLGLRRRPVVQSRRHRPHHRVAADLPPNPRGRAVLCLSARGRGNACPSLPPDQLADPPLARGVLFDRRLRGAGRRVVGARRRRRRRGPDRARYGS